MRNKAVLILTVFLLVFGLVTQASAEGGVPLKISKLGISVMPEYDTQDVLVLYSLTYQNESSQPFSGEIRFPVPKGTTSNIVTEKINNSDNHVNVRVEEKGDSAEFVWKPLQPIQPKANYEIHLEYYYNPLPGTGNKAFTYKFQANMPVGQPQIHIYQPLKASDFKMEPVGQLLGTDDKGFKVYGVSSASLKPGDKIEFKVSYTKDDPGPSVAPPSAASGDAGGAAQSTPSSKNQLSSAAVLVPLAALVIGVAIIAVKALSRSQSKDTRDVRRSSQPSRQRDKNNNSEFAQEKKKLRQQLLNGNISEEMYHDLLIELEQEYS